MAEYFPSEKSIIQLQAISAARSLIPPANPIITKNIENIEQKLQFKIEPRNNKFQDIYQRGETKSRNKNKNQESQSAHQHSTKRYKSKNHQYMQSMTLTNGYETDMLIFKRYDNKNLSKRCKKQFFSSLFMQIQGPKALKLPQYKGMLEDNDLIFDSNFQSANLMAVYKVEDRVYDLILQNDTNTKGFTQWYNFKIHNKRNNFVAKFNIVNLYKSKSLYSIGMKPIVRSEKSDRNTKKTWRRKCFNIYYEKNELNYQDNNKKCYKTLAFQYDFSVQNDTIQFAHGMPYDLIDLSFLLNSMKLNPQAKLSYIGSTIMKKQIPLIKIQSNSDNHLQKKAIVVLARQHPGQTPGSYICEQILIDLLKNSTQTEFLKWRFDLFIFPMVNMDGVALGNYRCNFAGFDLNRNWLKPDPIKHPQVYIIKNYIRKLQKKYKIELILDLHGHSRKMGSFFYGNNFGNNYMLFPFIASKQSKNILFQKSRFSHEGDNDPKASTARVVLGNMIKATGLVYTYQVSFYGNYKEDNQPFAFHEEHYKQIGKSLVQSIYKTYLQLYKEEKTLKQSYFLKTIKAQIQHIPIQKLDNDSGGSDSEAQSQMERQVQEIQQFLQQNKILDEISPPQIEITKKPSIYQGISRQLSISNRIKDIKDLGEPIEKNNQQYKQKIQNLLNKSINNDLREVILTRLPSIRKQTKRQSSYDEFQKLKNNINEDNLNLYLPEQQIFPNPLKGKRAVDPSYFRVKKFKNYADLLKVNGQTFALQERDTQRHLIAQRLQKIDKKNQTIEKNRFLQKINPSTMLINNNTPTPSSQRKGKLIPHINRVNLTENFGQQRDNLPQVGQRQILDKYRSGKNAHSLQTKLMKRGIP